MNGRGGTGSFGRMGFYTTKIFPALLDKMTTNPETDALRAEVLAPARGRVLEIGFGTGHNIPHLPASVTSVVGLDPNPGMEKIARPRIAAAAIPIELQLGKGEQLPFADGSFDTVVTTLVLCGVQDAGATLREIRRVLAPGGRYLFMEHGLAPDAAVQRSQRRMNGFSRLVFGCQLNRPIAKLLTDGGFELETVREFFKQNDPKFAGYTTLGVAAPQ